MSTQNPASVRLHVLVIAKEPDFDPEWPEWDWKIECPGPDHCHGFSECLEKHEVNGLDASDGPGDCPEDAPWADQEEYEFHGVLHEWQGAGWGWTVPFQGCVVADQDVSDCVMDIAANHGEGRHQVSEDWFDESSVTLEYVGPAEPQP